MLIHIATYPRAGNALLRDTIFLNWRYVTANGYPAADAWPAKLDAQDTDHPRILSYITPWGERRPLLRAGAVAWLTPDLRRELAARPEVFLFKTHEQPPQQVFEGERAVHMVRSPFASIVSHSRLEQKFSATPRPLEVVAHKGGPGGNWTDYHRAWLATSMPVLRLRYEAARLYPEGLPRALSSMFGPPVDGFKVMPMKASTERNRDRNPGEGLTGWRRQCTDEQADLIWQLHGEQASRLAYRAA